MIIRGVLAVNAFGFDSILCGPGHVDRERRIVAPQRTLSVDTLRPEGNPSITLSAYALAGGRKLR